MPASVSPRVRSDTRRIDATQFLHLALVEYHETRPAEDEEEIAAAEAGANAQRSALAGGMGGLATAPGRATTAKNPAGEVLVYSKEEQTRLFQEAEAQYEQRMRQLETAQSAANAQVTHDLQRHVPIQLAKALTSSR